MKQIPNYMVILSDASPPVRGAWIETVARWLIEMRAAVAPRAGGVD